MTLSENYRVPTEKERQAVTHPDDARFDDLFAQFGDGDSKLLFRRLLERGMRELIDAELTAMIGPSSMNGLAPAPTSATERGSGLCRHRRRHRVADSEAACHLHLWAGSTS